MEASFAMDMPSFHMGASAISLPQTSRTIKMPIMWRQQQLVKLQIMKKPPAAARCGCGGGGGSSRLVAEEILLGDEDWKEMLEGRWAAKCKGELLGRGVGMVELLECLEREAIMGEDHGKEPNDYNRRARIFDNSSRVFQALKDKDETHHPQP